MRKIKKKVIRRTIYFILIVLIGCIIYVLIPSDKIGNTNISLNNTKKEETIYEKLNLDGYSNVYNITPEYQTVIKDNKIYVINTKDVQIVDSDALLSNKELFEVRIKHFVHQKYNLSKADELCLKTLIYVFKEHDVTVYFDEYNSEDNVTVNYNELKDFLSFEPDINLDYEIEDNFELDPNKVTIALTFDDGPNGNRTLQLIDFLEKNECSATFFMQAKRLNSGKTAVMKVYNSHSEIGYHSYDHSYFTKQTSEKIREDFAKSDQMLYDLTGTHFTLTRPPYGSVKDYVLESIDNPFILWNLDTNDWKYRDAQNAKDYVMRNYKDGAIILFHDSYDSSVEAIKLIVPLLKAKGVQITSVSRLAKLKGIELKNNTIYRNLKTAN